MDFWYRVAHFVGKCCHDDDVDNNALVNAYLLLF